MVEDEDTIVAVSTPPGRGAIGIVRLSGGRAREIAEGLVETRRPLAAGRMRLGTILDERGVALDEAVVTLYAAPHSYTSEDVVEIACHGAPVLLEHVVRLALAAGVRLAEPGEFTQRAFLSGRLDLTQAEAVNDLIAAQTLNQARVAAMQLGGSVAKAVAPHKEKLVQLIAGLEAGIDFAEDDLDLLPDAEIAAQIEGVRGPLASLAESYGAGKVLREGFSLAIVGRPNAGKSSLFNRLLGRERAIVTAQAGTTRDSIEEAMALGGVPVRLIDTAGLRELTAVEEAEALGIARTRAAIAEADLVLHVIDASVDDEDREDEKLREMLVGRPYLVALNKCDLGRGTAGIPGGIFTSAITGEGMAALEAAMIAAVGVTPASSDSVMITNLRQHMAVAEAVSGLDRAQTGLAQGVPHEMLLLDLHGALEALDGLTGVTSSEDVLRLIFSRFCIGK